MSTPKQRAVIKKKMVRVRAAGLTFGEYTAAERTKAGRAWLKQRTRARTLRAKQRGKSASGRGGGG
jgi:hypothetical protein